MHWKSDRDLYDDSYQPDEVNQEVEQKYPQSLLQTKVKGLQEMLKRNLFKMPDDVDKGTRRRHSITLDGSIPEVLYDDIDCLADQVKDLEIADAAGEKHVRERLRQLSKGLLSRITSSKLSFESVFHVISFGTCQYGRKIVSFSKMCFPHIFIYSFN